jgi:hypothetical protein
MELLVSRDASPKDAIRTSFWLPPDLHRELRIAAADAGVSMSNIVIAALRRHALSASSASPATQDSSLTTTQIEHRTSISPAISPEN